MTRALLVMVHGSPHPEANGDMFEIVAAIRAMQRFDRVEVGFLDLNQPDIPTAIAECIAGGAAEIVAVPYFLHAGRHVVRDLPELLGEAARRYPDVRIRMGEFIGARPELDDAVHDRVAEALAAE